MGRVKVIKAIVRFHTVATTATSEGHQTAPNVGAVAPLTTYFIIYIL